MTDLDRWLDGRRPAAPAELRRAIDECVDQSDGFGSIHDRLATAGVRALERAVNSVGDRSSASLLLAADALLTYACEAAAEAGPAELDRLLGTLDLARFSELVGERGR